MKYFWYSPQKVKFLFICSIKGKNLTISSHFSLNLLSSAHLVGIILGVNIVCTYTMVYNVILMNEYKEICGLRKLLDAVVGLTLHAS